jgi:hypothetical protein
MPVGLTEKGFLVSWSNGRYEAPAFQIEDRQIEGGQRRWE